MKPGVSSSPSILQIKIRVTNSVDGGLTVTNKINDMAQGPLYLATESLFEKMSHHAEINMFNRQPLYISLQSALTCLLAHYISNHSQVIKKLNTT